jgi:hypothetical protein
VGRAGGASVTKAGEGWAQGRSDCGLATPPAQVRCGVRIRTDPMSPPPSGVPGRCTGQDLTLDQAWLSSLVYLFREGMGCRGPPGHGH